MAESCTVAFGRYLRMLRERRGLSLEDVATMSRSLADPVDKSYLSRCENGRYGIGFSKSITLSRIYGVPNEVLAERMELDTELDRIGGPDTAGLSYAEMQKRAVAAMGRGLGWEAYAYFRDALPLARQAPLSESFRDATEQLLIGCMNVSSVAAILGRFRYSVHELEYISETHSVSAKHAPALLDLLSARYRALQQFDKARDLARQAVFEAERDGTTSYLGFVYSNSARLACDEGQLAQGLKLYQQAFKAHKKVGQSEECARALLNIASTYFDQSRYRAARLAAVAAERIAAPLGMDRIRALLRILLGEIAEAENHSSLAVERWLEAADIARKVRDKILQFKAGFPLFRHLLAKGDETTARALERRLLRLSAWVPDNLEELTSFRQLSRANQPPRSRRVSRTQPPPSPMRN
ncbi:MAG: helix-turn-helix domain-containing protein [Acidobacteriia bacterium]|nr:helix-turn-helix domain-containing protein [Terriglobia bacterium]